jgi:hypothetical protein
MPNQSISAQLSLSDRDAVMAAIATIKAKLPFLIDLSADERKALPKMGDKSRAFVSKAMEVATQNPDFLPRSFDLAELQKDVQLFEALYPVLMSLTQLQDLVDDTCLAVGSEAYAAALQVYTYAKAGGQGTGLETAVEELGLRFARKPRKSKSQTASVKPEGAAI